MRGSHQVLEFIYRRFRVSKFGVQKCCYPIVIRFRGSTPELIRTNADNAEDFALLRK